MIPNMDFSNEKWDLSGKIVQRDGVLFNITGLYQRYDKTFMDNC